MAVRVLVVDDDHLVCKILQRHLNNDPRFEVVGVAYDAFEARDLLVRLNPDVMTLDIEMPRMNGLEFLERLLPQFPIPVVMVSSLSTPGARAAIRSLELGAVEVVGKPAGDVPNGVKHMLEQLSRKIINAASVPRSMIRPAATPTLRTKPTTTSEYLHSGTELVVAIGASTGGTEAVRVVLEGLEPSVPGVVIVQHMPKGYTKAFADRLNELCTIHVEEATDGARLRQGVALVIPAGRQGRVKRAGKNYIVALGEVDKHTGHCPSADVLFASVARTVGKDALGVLLTGMGKDGADGLLMMRRAGALTVAQDEATSIVFGMPKAARDNGGAGSMKPLGSIPRWIMGHAQRQSATGR